jgi:hypothetical protein
MPLFTPIGGGGVGKATVTSTTGSPTVDTTSRAGKTIYKFTGSGSITFGTAGTCELLIIGGGGGASAGGGGAGGYIYKDSIYLPAGAQTVTVGAGGAAYARGVESKFFDFTAFGGGRAAYPINSENTMTSYTGLGGSGGGGFQQTNTTPGAAISGQGNIGGYGTGQWGAGGGGGAGAVGNNGGGYNGGAGGDGLSNSITGTSTYYAGGGGGTSQWGANNTGGAGGLGGGGNADYYAGNYLSGSNGTANTGGGAGGIAGTNHSGGSGVVIIVIG